MGTEAERQVRIRVTSDVEPVWIVENLGIAVRGRVVQHHSIVLAKLMSLVRHVFGHRATHIDDRSCPSNKFFDRTVPVVTSFEKLVLVRILCQLQEAMADVVAGRFVAGNEQQGDIASVFLGGQLTPLHMIDQD